MNKENPTPRLESYFGTGVRKECTTVGCKTLTYTGKCDECLNERIRRCLEEHNKLIRKEKRDRERRRYHGHARSPEGDGKGTRNECKTMWCYETAISGYSYCPYHTRKHWFGITLRGIKRRVKKEGMPCTLTVGDLETLWCKQNGKCALSGKPMDYVNPPNVVGDGFSVDRENPELGYVVGNVQLVTHMENSKKGNSSLPQLTISIPHGVQNVHLYGVDVVRAFKAAIDDAHEKLKNIEKLYQSKLTPPETVQVPTGLDVWVNPLVRPPGCSQKR